MAKTIPLNALRAFEVAARLGSFKHAGEELGVTSAAVGQQVRKLEELIGQPLFIRSLNGLTMTEKATQVLPEIHRGFDHLAMGYDAMLTKSNNPQLSISAPPTFTIKWLVPRLPSFHAAHPGVELKIYTDMEFVDVQRGAVDLAIRFGSGHYRGLKRKRLFNDWVIPLCAPDIWRNANLPLSAASLQDFKLIHLDGETSDRNWVDWPRWGATHGLGKVGLEDGPHFNQSAAVLQSAIEGQGIALCGLVFALGDILSGRLCAPFGPASALETKFGYDLVYRPLDSDNATLKCILDWLERQAEEHHQGILSYLEEKHQKTDSHN